MACKSIIKNYNCIYTSTNSINTKLSTIISLINVEIRVLYSEYTLISYFPWLHDSSIKMMSIIFETELNGNTLNILIENGTTNTIIKNIYTNNDGFYEIFFDVPNNNSRLKFSVQKNISNGNDPQIFGINLKLYK